MKRISFILIFIFCTVTAVLATDLPVGNPEDGNTIVSTSKKKLNIRSGAGTTYGVVGQLLPREHAWVTDIETASSGWVKINTGKKEGYVKTEYIKSVNGNDYIDWINNHSENNKEGKSSSKWLSSLKGSLSVFTDVFENLMKVKWWIIVFGFLIMIGIQIIIAWMLKRKYSVYESPALLYWIIGIAGLLNLAVLAMFPASTGFERYERFIWLMLVLSVFPLYVYACWRLEQNGKVDNRYYRANTKCGYFGKYLGILGWLVMGLAIVRTIYNITDKLLYGLIPIPDEFLWMIGTVVVILALLATLTWYWMGIVERTLHFVSNIIVYLITVAVFVIITMAGFDIINVFNGWYYAIAFVGMLIGFMAPAVAISMLRDERCSNCHNFMARHTGTTDGGTSKSTHERWVGIDNWKIESNRKVSNAQELQRTTYTNHHKTRHMRCDYCGHTWDRHSTTTVKVDTQSLARKWEESK